ncbi:MAG: cobalamin-dependent protein [Ilumatobacteraceae bacterium]
MSDEVLSQPAVMSLQEAADILDVHYMTAYRYVRQGRLRATRSKGVWNVTAEALDEFRASKSEKVAKKAPSGDRRRTGNYVRELEHCLIVTADAPGAWDVLKRAIDAGNEVEDVYLDILTPALARIGEMWAGGEIDIAVEHQATSIATRLVGQLSPRCSRRGRRRGDILIGAPSGERHALPLAMLADLLRLKGWEVYDLGADTPADSFVHAASKVKDLKAVGVSVTSTDSVDGAVDVVRSLRRAIGDEFPVILGGNAIQGIEHARSLGADFFAQGARGFMDFLDQLTSQLSDRDSHEAQGEPVAEPKRRTESSGKSADGATKSKSAGSKAKGAVASSKAKGSGKSSNGTSAKAKGNGTSSNGKSSNGKSSNGTGNGSNGEHRDDGSDSGRGPKRRSK